MDKTAPAPVEIPTALPGSEADDAREKLLLEATSEDPKDETDEEDLALASEPVKPKKRRWHVMRTLAGFAAFVCILAVAISWFFGMGWFAEQKAQPISRSVSKDGQTTPATEDEKLKMALSLVAPPPPTSVADPIRPQAVDENDLSKGIPEVKQDNTSVPSAAGGDDGRSTFASSPESYSLSSPKENASDKTPSEHSKTVGIVSAAKVSNSEDARGRSLFFGITKDPKEVEKSKSVDAQVTTITSQKEAAPAQIPFGTLLPVRLVGSIYTLRNSGGFVRMELTRPVEGKGYSYPAGTLVLGNVRSGESTRAFVTVVGLLDPVSGELVKFSGELLGRDGASGIEGKRRNLTSQWARVFRGMKDTAASVLGSVGALRSGSTVILSEPIRRGTESMSEDLSSAILKNDREETFLEVAATSNGYVLVTGLPENSTSTVGNTIKEASKE